MQLEIPSHLTVEELTESDDLEALVPEWSALWNQCPTATPFQSPAWLISWWRHFEQGQLWTLACREQGQLIGILPVFVQADSKSKKRCLLFIGTGISDYLDIVATPKSQDNCMAGVCGHLQTRQDQWDFCDFHQLRSNSPILSLANHPSWNTQKWPQECCPVPRLPASIDHLSDRVPKRLLENWRYSQRH